MRRVQEDEGERFCLGTVRVYGLCETPLIGQCLLVFRGPAGIPRLRWLDGINVILEEAKVSCKPLLGKAG